MALGHILLASPVNIYFLVHLGRISPKYPDSDFSRKKSYDYMEPAFLYFLIHLFTHSGLNLLSTCYVLFHTLLNKTDKSPCLHRTNGEDGH